MRHATISNFQERAKRNRSCQQVDVRIEATCSTEVGLEPQLKDLKAKNQALRKDLKRQAKKTAALKQKLADAGLKAHTGDVNEELSQQLDQANSGMTSAYEESVAGQSGGRPAACKYPRTAFISSANTSREAMVGSAEELSSLVDSSDTTSIEASLSDSSVSAQAGSPGVVFRARANREYNKISHRLLGCNLYLKILITPTGCNAYLRKF